MHETDRRVRFTKMMIHESLLKLLNEKPIENISVTELCRRADVNRGTFYSHYRQPSDVLDEIENDLLCNLKSIIARDNRLDDIHREVLVYLDANRNTCRVLLGKNGRLDCMQRIVDMSKEKFSSMWDETLGMNIKNMEYLHQFIFSGTVAIIRDWLLSENESAPDEVSDAIIDIQKRIFQMFKIDPIL